MMNPTFLQQELEELQAKDLYRSLRVLSEVQGTRARLEGIPILLFCGNDYLGLSQHPRLIEAAGKAAKKYGVGAGASRLVSGTSAVHTRVEEKIAGWKGKEKALLFSSGYLTNLGVLSALAGEKDLIVMDKLCHASLIDGARLSGATIRVFPHKNYERCDEIFEKNQDYPRKLLVSDTVFSMDGDLADLNALVKIKKQFGAILIVDDAHGTGVMGLRGRGAAEDSGLEPEIDVIIGTTSKALGCLGGFAAASAEVIDYLINSSRAFIFSTAIPPVLCAVIDEALTLLDEQPQIRHKLWRNIQILHEGLSGLGLIQGPIISPIFPVIFGEEKAALKASQYLKEQGILVPAIRYPTVPKGKARLRITISSLHEKEEIDLLLSALRTIRSQV
ncbi:MAG: 8-amino-7-oxononanoate synthase [Candidatus Omnitrophica bacterium]|nr:8-amino-7-oxononanoate synthase [Candidatus Omnitrophota bacterium]